MTFIRTTQDRHIKGAQAFWQKLQNNNALYKGKYEGWYAVRDEAFYTKEQVEMKDGVRVAKASGAEVEWLEEQSYFFRLSDYQDRLLEYYSANPDFIAPKSRYNEVVSFVKSGLRDLSVSRTSFKWGIPVPNDEAHIMYVWIDALVNYISALGYPDEGGKFAHYWPAAFTYGWQGYFDFSRGLLACFFDGGGLGIAEKDLRPWLVDS